MLNENKNHKIMLLWLEGTCRVILSNPPAQAEPHKQAAQDHIQMVF